MEYCDFALYKTDNAKNCNVNMGYLDTDNSDGTSLKTTWTNMKTDKQFPVSTGTVLSLSCNEEYKLKGDKTVTCTTNTKFQFSVEPNCGRHDCG